MKTIRSTYRIVVEEVVQDDDDTHEEANSSYESVIKLLSETYLNVLQDQSALETVIILQD